MYMQWHVLPVNNCTVSLNNAFWTLYVRRLAFHYHKKQFTLPPAVHHAAKSTIMQSSVFDMDNTREWENEDKKTGIATQPRFPSSSSVVLYYCCQREIWGRIVGESSGSHSTKYRHCWWSVAWIGLFVSFRYVRVIISSVTTMFSNSLYFTCVRR